MDTLIIPDEFLFVHPFLGPRLKQLAFSPIIGIETEERHMTREEMKKAVCDAIDAHADEIIAIGEDIFKHPELGYKETRTSGIVRDTFNKLGLSHEDGLALTGVKARLKNSGEGPVVAIMGELDAVVCPEHPDADKSTGAAHSCGHNGQIASMLGAAYGLTKSGVKDFLSGDVVFFAVPAEECVELEFRSKIRAEGKIHYYGGKQELIHSGAFDDIDMAMLVHGMENSEKNVINVGSGSVGFVTKKVRFIGKEAHAGLCPENGINALNAATLALSAINAMRETFRDQDCIRVHPILTKGGDLVNIVPADVRLETYVRGRSIEAIKDANFKVNRAIKGAAYAVGAEAVIEDVPGYLPVHQNAEMSALFSGNACALFDSPVVETEEIGGASSDIGDVCSIIPTIQPTMGGFAGGFHSKNLQVVDKNKAYIAPAKAMAMTAVDLLCDKAERAKAVCAAFKGLSAEEYDALWHDMLRYDDSL